MPWFGGIYGFSRGTLIASCVQKGCDSQRVGAAPGKVKAMLPATNLVQMLATAPAKRGKWGRKDCIEHRNQYKTHEPTWLSDREVNTSTDGNSVPRLLIAVSETNFTMQCCHINWREPVASTGKAWARGMWTMKGGKQKRRRERCGMQRTALFIFFDSSCQNRFVSFASSSALTPENAV